MKDRKHPKLELATVLPPLGVFLFAACLMMMAVVSTGCGGDDSGGGGTNDTSMVEVMEPETETTNDMTQADMPEAAPEPAPAPSPVPLPPIPGNVLALGDSITEGFGQESWVTKLSRLKPLNFINAGVRGNRASQAADRLPGLIERHRPETVLILLGTNDALGRNVQSALTGIQDATQIARSAGASVVIGTIPPILLRGSETPEPEPEPETETEPDPDPEPTPDPDPTPDPTPDPADPDPELSPTDPDPNADPDKIDPPEDMTAARDPDPRNAIVQEINDAIRAFAEANGIPVADPNSLIGDGIGLMLEDGFHPTDMGQELIAIAFNSAF